TIRAARALDGGADLFVVGKPLALVDLGHQGRRFDQQVHHVALFRREERGIGRDPYFGELIELRGEVVAVRSLRRGQGLLGGGLGARRQGQEGGKDKGSHGSLLHRRFAYRKSFPTRAGSRRRH